MNRIISEAFNDIQNLYWFIFFGSNKKNNLNVKGTKIRIFFLISG